MLKDQMKQRVLAAMKAGHTIERDVLRVALGEVQTAESRTGQAASEDEVGKILRKLIKSNEESLDAGVSAERAHVLKDENAVLASLLPRSLTIEEIVAALASVADAVRAAGNDGRATGVAMKHLRAAGAAVEGRDVGAAVRRLRA